jgi:cell fate (sporulation/competence/biofilm development) regulator YlbF (YheA/YmcA/DUF963 family)
LEPESHNRIHGIFQPRRVTAKLGRRGQGVLRQKQSAGGLASSDAGVILPRFVNIPYQMQTAAAPALDLVAKTQELCQTVLDQPNFNELRQRVEAFLNDELVKFKFQMVNEKGNILQMKQSGGMPINSDEIAEFQKMREELLANPVAMGFIEAQTEMQRIHDSVNKYLTKTFELGRVPQPEDLDDGSCCSSGGCGCS